MSQSLEDAVRVVVHRLAGGEYLEAVGGCNTSRLTAEEVRQIVVDYGRTLVKPPADAYQSLDAVRINDPSREAWSVWVPLWTQEEGRSDLTLMLKIVREGDRIRIELDDLHLP